MPSDPLVEARDVFERAIADAEYARRVWVEAERPLRQEANNGLWGSHPLWKALLDADDRVRKSADLVARLAGRKPVGRPAGAASAADRVEPPRIRAVK